MLSRVLSSVFGLGSLAAIAAALWCYFQPPGEDPRIETAVEVEPAQRELKDVVIGGHEQIVEFRIINHSRRTIRVVGSEFG